MTVKEQKEAERSGLATVHTENTTLETSQKHEVYQKYDQPSPRSDALGEEDYAKYDQPQQIDAMALLMAHQHQEVGTNHNQMGTQPENRIDDQDNDGHLLSDAQNAKSGSPDAKEEVDEVEKEEDLGLKVVISVHQTEAAKRTPSPAKPSTPPKPAVCPSPKPAEVKPVEDEPAANEGPPQSPWKMEIPEEERSHKDLMEEYVLGELTAEDIVNQYQKTRRHLDFNRRKGGKTKKKPAAVAQKKPVKKPQATKGNEGLSATSSLTVAAPWHMSMFTMTAPLTACTVEAP